MMEFYSEKTPTARKEHECEMCGRAIKIGEKHVYQSGKYDGDFFSRRYHNECADILNRFCDETGDNEFNYDLISEWWDDRYCYGCKYYENNGGECDGDRDRICWCTRFEKED